MFKGFLALGVSIAPFLDLIGRIFGILFFLIVAVWLAYFTYQAMRAVLHSLRQGFADEPRLTSFYVVAFLFLGAYLIELIVLNLAIYI